MRDEADEPGSGGSPEPDPTLPDPRRRHTRRWFLAAAGAVVAGAGGGVAVAFTHRPPRAVPHRPPQVLLDAYAAERRLVDSAAATARAESGASEVVTELRGDHEAHLSALRAQLARFDPPSRAARRRATELAGRPVTASAALAGAERVAAQHAAARANQLAAAEPVTATLLASIAACESGHVLLLQ